MFYFKMYSFGILDMILIDTALVTIQHEFITWSSVLEMGQAILKWKINILDLFDTTKE